jgi:hypothetical protein
LYCFPGAGGEKAEGAGHCKEEDYEEDLDQAGLKTAKAHRPSRKRSLPKGFEGYVNGCPSTLSLKRIM